MSRVGFACAIALLLAHAAAAAENRVIDSGDDPSPWAAIPADGVSLRIGSDRGDRGRGDALRFDFDFHGGGGYAVAHRKVDLELPENYAFVFRIRGQAPVNHLEFKLVDPSGDNVWWHVERDLEWPRAWREIVIPKRKIGFAWGPQGGGEIRRVAAIEFAITAGSGGRGTVWIDALELRPLPPADAVPPAPLATASSATPSGAASLAVDADSMTAWEARSSDRRPWLELDLGIEREFGGLVIEWALGRHAIDYDLEAAGTDGRWRMLRRVRGSNGGRDALPLPESQARSLRLRVLRRASDSDGVALQTLALQPLAWAATRAAFLEAEARRVPRGTFPRGMSGEQVFWTVLGGTRDGDEFLLSEDGALEIGLRGFTLEPFVHESGRLHSWADVTTSQRLEQGALPLPAVQWTWNELALDIVAVAAVDSGAPRSVSYAIENRGATSRRGTLYVAIRPFQVNPPAQFLNLPGGPARVTTIEGDTGRLIVNGARSLRLSPPARSVAMLPWDGGDLVSDFLRADRLPPKRVDSGTKAGRAQRLEIDDPEAAASGVMRFDWALEPGDSRTFAIDLGSARTSNRTPRAAAPSLATAVQDWQRELGEARIEIPDTLVTQTLAAQIGFILVNREQVAIRPGTRSYRRSWIRDGALTSSALLRMGHTAAATDFLDWYAPHQYANGKIPCVVDWRGADPTPEHDSNGEFIFLVAECLRFDRDTDRAARLWPRVQAAVAYLDSLRGLRRTAEFRDTQYFGLLPPSISHEGYSAKPMHSYWDDLWALRGFTDAAFLAGRLGHEGERARMLELRDSFATDLTASIRTAMRVHGIDFVPGCADLGDFDATSTTIALSPVQAGDVVPPDALERTFERYWENFQARRDGTQPWDGFTPYELRNVGAFVRLGWRERAHELLQWFFAQQRPTDWRQWPEVVYREARAQRFLGDLPHGWVGSDYVRSVLEMFAYEDEASSALVLAHGVPSAWLQGDGVVVRALPTPFGPLTYTARRDGAHVEMRIETGLDVPAGGLVVRMPPFADLQRVTLDGARIAPAEAGTIVVRTLPAEIVWAP